MNFQHFREILEQQLYFSTLATKVPCTCGQCFDPARNDTGEIQTYECEMCSREVPWCFGQDDDYFELCDDCAVRMLKIDRCPCGRTSKLDCFGECALEVQHG